MIILFLKSVRPAEVGGPARSGRSGRPVQHPGLDSAQSQSIICNSRK